MSLLIYNVKHYLYEQWMEFDGIWVFLRYSFALLILIGAVTQIARGRQFWPLEGGRPLDAVLHVVTSLASAATEHWMELAVLAMFFWMFWMIPRFQTMHRDVIQMKSRVGAITQYLNIEAETSEMRRRRRKFSRELRLGLDKVETDILTEPFNSLDASTATPKKPNGHAASFSKEVRDLVALYSSWEYDEPIDYSKWSSYKSKNWVDWQWYENQIKEALTTLPDSFSDHEIAREVDEHFKDYRVEVANMGDLSVRVGKVRENLSIGSK